MRRQVIGVIIIAILFTALLLKDGVCNAYAADEENEEPRVFFEIDLEEFGKTKMQIYEGFDFLNRSSSELQWKLALNAAVLSKAVYEKQADKVFELLGYDLVYDRTDREPAPLQPTFTMAYKMLVDSSGRKKNVFAIVVKGTSTNPDIITDLVDGSDMFTSTELFTIKLVKNGIEVLANKSLEELEKEDNYIFLTGHSLGGAVANKMSVDENLRKLVRNDKNKIYTYTFESPHTCVNTWFENVYEMSNAYNFKDIDDPITHIVPLFGSTTYGKDVTFSVNDLRDDILHLMYEAPAYNSLRDFYHPVIFYDQHTLTHHNIISSFVYILQNGNLVEDYKRKDIPTKPRLSEVVFYSRKDIQDNYQISAKEFYDYDSKGRLIEKKVCKLNGEVTEQETREYDSKGRMIKKVQSAYYFENDEEFKFRNGRFFSEIESKTEQLNSYRVVTQYDENGHIINLAVLNSRGKTVWDCDLSYSDSGLNVSIDSYEWVVESGANDRVDGYCNWYYMEYNSKGYLIVDTLTGHGPYESKYEYEYDRYGRCTAKRYYSGSRAEEDDPIVLRKETIYVYNDRGDLAEESYRDFDSGVSSKKKYEIEYDYLYKCIVDPETDSGHYWEYDELNRVIREGGDSDKIHVWLREYSYTDRGDYLSKSWSKWTIKNENGAIKNQYEVIEDKVFIYQDYLDWEEAAWNEFVEILKDKNVDFEESYKGHEYPKIIAVADYDNDGEEEAFLSYHKHIGFANKNGVEYVASAIMMEYSYSIVGGTTVFAQGSDYIWKVGDRSFFVYRHDVLASSSSIYGVKNGSWYADNVRGWLGNYFDGRAYWGSMQFDQTDYEEMDMSRTRTCPDYFVYWDGQGLCEYGGIEITKEELLRCYGASYILDSIEGDIKQIIYRENGIININYQVEKYEVLDYGDSPQRFHENHIVTLLLSDGAVRLYAPVVYESYFDIPKGHVYGISQLVGTELERVTYPKEFPVK